MRARLELLSFYVKIGLTNYDEVGEYQEAEVKKQDRLHKQSKKIVHKFVYDKQGMASRGTLDRRKKINQGLAAFTKVWISPIHLT